MQRSRADVMGWVRIVRVCDPFALEVLCCLVIPTLALLHFCCCQEVQCRQGSWANNINSDAARHALGLCWVAKHQSDLGRCTECCKLVYQVLRSGVRRLLERYCVEARLSF